MHIDQLQEQVSEHSPDLIPAGTITRSDDPVNHPSHYTAGSIECIDAIEAATTGLTGGNAYNTGVAIKYLWRWSLKNGVEDLEKARWYVDRLISSIKGGAKDAS
ncbi:DUF3310 domain-containing protein [Paenibacillus sp. S3N08]|uniref:DUF3310 domain-containing protein n=2 Tax=Paenibacillus agricola TaxID=2716264 RepID=A0ABX0JGX4_9BACL|nr:DUF3310 domain-containing protein [Paenibacillus agricola]